MPRAPGNDVGASGGLAAGDHQVWAQAGCCLNPAFRYHAGCGHGPKALRRRRMTWPARGVPMRGGVKRFYWRLMEWLRRDARNWFASRLPRRSTPRWKAAQRAELEWWRCFLDSGQWRELAEPKPRPGESWLEHRKSFMDRWESEFGLPLAALIGTDDLVLDLGSGPCSLVRRGRAIALDPLAGEYTGIVDLPGDTEVGYVAGVGERLPFADGAFDVVWSRNVIDHVRDPVLFITEAMRVLRPGGRFLLTFDTISKPSVYHPHAGLNESWVREHVRGRITDTYPLPSQELMVVIEKEARSADVAARQEPHPPGFSTFD
jgi:SAM-dependent methyltransferase